MSSIYRIRSSSDPVPDTVRILEGEALIQDMRAYREAVTATPETARKFLIELGVITPDGKKINLIKD